jgi:preprotein translocase subunit YajC
MELLPMLLLFGLLGLMMYFMSRRQRRAVQQQQALQSSLTVGDKVMTTSGLYGIVTSTADDATIDIEIAPGVETTWLRAAVREKVGPDVDVEEELGDELEEHEAIDETVEADDAKKSANGEVTAADNEPVSTVRRQDGKPKS